MIDGLTIDHFGQIQFLILVKNSISVKISVSIKILVWSKFRFWSKTGFQNDITAFSLADGLKSLF